MERIAPQGGANVNVSATRHGVRRLADTRRWGMSDNTQQQIDQLRTKIEQLLRERVTPALADVADRAEGAARRVRERSEEVSGHVRERPLSAIAIALLAGFLLGAITKSSD